MACKTPQWLSDAIEDAWGLPRGAILEWGGDLAGMVAVYATDEQKAALRSAHETAHREQ